MLEKFNFTNILYIFAMVKKNKCIKSYVKSDKGKAISK